MNGVTVGASWYRRGIASLFALGMAVALLSPARADDLEDRIRDREGQLEDTEQRLGDLENEINHSTKALNDATKAYRNAIAKLPAAEKALGNAQAALSDANQRLEVAEGEVAAARAADAKAADKLAKAEQRVKDQLAKIDKVNKRIDGKRASISRVATQAYQRGTGGELATLAAALNASDLHELLTNVEATRSVVGAETMILTDLRDDRAELANERVVLEDLEAEAEELRQQAAEHLKKTKRLEAQARQARNEAAQATKAAAAAKADVEALVATREDAKVAARQAKAANERQYEQLESDRNNVQAEIDRLEREHAERERERERENNDDDHDDPPPEDDDDSDDSSGGLAFPVSNPYVTSPYGMRVHPVTGGYTLHDGTDLRAYCGTPIRAAASGTVAWAYYQGGYGNQVAVDHGGMVTTYSHLDSFAVGPGSHVSQGDVVGYSGNTGYSTACHLHFMLYIGGALQDPMAHLG